MNRPHPIPCCLAACAAAALLATPGGCTAPPETAGQEPATAAEEITLIAADGLVVTADLYATQRGPRAPLILLFHQAGWSRGEYREIAPELVAMGFSCLAVDQRSGGEVNGVVNATHARAVSAGRGTSYLDALPDLEAALAWASERHPEAPLLLWGSSYSASLVLAIAGDKPDLADAVLAFAPGEYFAELGRPADWITRAAAKIRAPVFLTSARQEKDAWWGIWEAIESPGKSYYLPETAGNHGSRALWRRFPDHQGYWQALRGFLSPFRPQPSAE